MEAVQKGILKLFAPALLPLLACAGAMAGEAHFILVIDPSARMDNRREATTRTILDLVASGFHERIRPGDLFSMGTAPWTDNLARIEWDPQRAREIANQAAAAAGGLPLGRMATGARELALTNLNSVLDRSPQVTAVLLCDGFRPVRGTTFDSRINRLLTQHRERFSRAATPMVLAMVGDHGQWTAWSAQTNVNRPIEFPETAMAEVREQARALGRALDLSPPKEEAKPAETKIIARAEPVAVEPAPIIPAPKVEEPVQAVVSPAPEPAATPTPTPTVAPVPEPASPPPQPVAAEVALPEDQPAPATAPPLNPPVALAVVSQPLRRADTPPFPWKTLAVALGFVAVAGFAVYRRLTKPQPVAGSLISQSIGGQSPRRRLKAVPDRKGD